MERLRRADPAAVGEVYDEHHRAVRAFAKRLVGESSEAEDLVHDVFVSLPKVMKNYRGESPLRTFLIAIAINKARHHVRAAARRRRAMSSVRRTAGARRSSAIRNRTRGGASSPGC